jgi:hypothetical protein
MVVRDLAADAAQRDGALGMQAHTRHDGHGGEAEAVEDSIHEDSFGGKAAGGRDMNGKVSPPNKFIWTKGPERSL